MGCLMLCYPSCDGKRAGTVGTGCSAIQMNKHTGLGLALWIAVSSCGKQLFILMSSVPGRVAGSFL